MLQEQVALRAIRYGKRTPKGAPFSPEMEKKMCRSAQVVHYTIGGLTVAWEGCASTYKPLPGLVCRGPCPCGAWWTECYTMVGVDVDTLNCEMTHMGIALRVH